MAPVSSQHNISSKQLELAVHSPRTDLGFDERGVYLYLTYKEEACEIRRSNFVFGGRTGRLATELPEVACETEKHLELQNQSLENNEFPLIKQKPEAFPQMYRYACEMRPFLPKQSGPILKCNCFTLENIDPKSDQELVSTPSLSFNAPLIPFALPS